MHWDCSTSGNMSTGGIVTTAFVWFMVVAFYILVCWKLFLKAGKPGWASIIPIYNVIVILEICGKPIWWLILCFIPIVNFVIGFKVSIELAKRFGKGPGTESRCSFSASS